VSDTVDPGLQDKITVVSTIDNETYVFRIPTLQEQVQFGFAVRRVRRRYDPENVGDPSGLDGMTFELTYGMATFEMLLHAGPEWVWKDKPSADTKPVVDSSTFTDPKKMSVIMEVSGKYWTEVNRFRA
jgi:hypothetical protein